jgi:hypothetical protein
LLEVLLYELVYSKKQFNKPNPLNMPSVSTILKGLVALAPLVAAAPANYARQESASKSSSMVMSSATPAAAAITETAGEAASPAAAAPAAAATLSDVDILNL